MTRIILAGITSLIGIGGYLVCGTPDCEAPGYLRVNVVQADGQGGFKPAKVDTVEYFVSAAPADHIDRPLTQVLNADCTNGECTTWRVAPGDSGEITVTAKVCGQSFEEIALVDRDMQGCVTGDSQIDLVVDLTACPPGAEPPSDNGDALDSHVVNCTTELRPSVELHTWRQHGDFFLPVKVAGVTYDLGGPRAETPAPSCVDEGCTVWSVGAEMAGIFDLNVETCGQVQQRRVEVPKTADGCHVVTQRVDMAIESTGCLAAIATPNGSPPTVDPIRSAGAGNPGNDTFVPKPIGDPPLPPESDKHIDGSCTAKAVARPAFVAHLVKRVDGDMLVPVVAKGLRYTYLAKRRLMQATCAQEPCTDWVGEARVAGEYELTATVCGKDDTLTVKVPKSEDGCGVATQSLMWEVDTSDCLTGEPVDIGGPSPSDHDAPK